MIYSTNKKRLASPYLPLCLQESYYRHSPKPSQSHRSAEPPQYASPLRVGRSLLYHFLKFPSCLLTGRVSSIHIVTLTSERQYYQRDDVDGEISAGSPETVTVLSWRDWLMLDAWKTRVGMVMKMMVIMRMIMTLPMSYFMIHCMAGGLS